MQIPKIAKQYHVDETKLFSFLSKEKPKGFKIGFWTDYVEDDADIDAIIEAFKQFEANKDTKKSSAATMTEAEKERQKEAEDLKRKALASMLITSGFNFDGYKITKYSGYISGDDAINVDRGFAVFGTGVNIKDKLMESLVTIRRNALAELKESAYALGCNAVIGVDFDYLTLDPQTANIRGGTTYQPYVFGVTANGNAVIIEKITE